jgi:hypothetical protein
MPISAILRDLWPRSWKVMQAARSSAEPRLRMISNLRA